MNRFFALTALAVTAFTGCATAAELPLPDQPVAKDLPGAKELPDPSLTYKIVFDISKAAGKIDEVNPTLNGIARFINTLAKAGVPADHRKIAVVFHQQGTPAVLNNDEFKARNQGHDNPNIALIRELAKAGVDFRVCGQALIAGKIDPKMVQPEIEIDLWAATTLANLQMRGYVRFGN
jgi:intracellular sulfur oxidation DsrE/DsrF family protein